MVEQIKNKTRKLTSPQVRAPRHSIGRHNSTCHTRQENNNTLDRGRLLVRVWSRTKHCCSSMTLKKNRGRRALHALTRPFGQQNQVNKMLENTTHREHCGALRRASFYWKCHDAYRFTLAKMCSSPSLTSYILHPALLHFAHLHILYVNRSCYGFGFN